MRPQLAVIDADLLNPIILGLSTSVSEATKRILLAVITEVSRGIIRDNLWSRGDIGLDAGGISSTKQRDGERRSWKGELHGDYRVS